MSVRTYSNYSTKWDRVVIVNKSDGDILEGASCDISDKDGVCGNIDVMTAEALRVELGLEHGLTATIAAKCNKENYKQLVYQARSLRNTIATTLSNYVNRDQLTTFNQNLIDRYQLNADKLQWIIGNVYKVKDEKRLPNGEQKPLVISKRGADLLLEILQIGLERMKSLIPTPSPSPSPTPYPSDIVENLQNEVRTLQATVNRRDEEIRLKNEQLNAIRKIVIDCLRLHFNWDGQSDLEQLGYTCTPAISEEFNLDSTSFKQILKDVYTKENPEFFNKDRQLISDPEVLLTTVFQNFLNKLAPNGISNRFSTLDQKVNQLTTTMENLTLSLSSLARTVGTLTDIANIHLIGRGQQTQQPLISPGGANIEIFGDTAPVNTNHVSRNRSSSTSEINTTSIKQTVIPVKNTYVGRSPSLSKVDISTARFSLKHVPKTTKQT